MNGRFYFYLRSELFGDGEDLLGEFCNVTGKGEGEVDVAIVCQSSDSVEEGENVVHISAADFQSGVNKNVGHVVVGSADTAKQTIKGVVTLNAVVIGIYQHLIYNPTDFILMLKMLSFSIKSIKSIDLVF